MGPGVFSTVDTFAGFCENFAKAALNQLILKILSKRKRRGQGTKALAIRPQGSLEKFACCACINARFL